jgi:hypothetical protein
MIAKGSNTPLDEARAERRSGGKDLERQPRTARIQTCQRYENVQFDTIADLPSFNKDPHSSKALPAGRPAGREPDCLSAWFPIAIQPFEGKRHYQLCMLSLDSSI